MIHKVTNMFVGNGSALETSLTAPTSGKIGIFGNNQTVLAAAETIATIGKDSIYFSETFADGSSKKSPFVKGTHVTAAKSESYAPAQREVWTIGFNRKTAAGSIEVNNSTDYTFSIVFKNDKSFYSDRQEMFKVTFTSATSATQLSIATQIAALINDGSFASQVVAIVVGDGTGVYGVTGATNYGVEITAKDIAQFTSSTYKENRVMFSVHVDDSTGFEATACAQISASSFGTGTYNWVYNFEKFVYQYEGLQNLRMWPAQTQSQNVSSAGKISDIVAGTGNVGATQNLDVITFATTNAMLSPGELVELNGTMYEIKYLIGTTSAVLTSPFLGATDATVELKLKMFYDLIVINFIDTSFTSGPDVVSQARKSIYIATPAIDAGAAYTANSTEKAALIAALNPWLASTPLAPTALA